MARSQHARRRGGIALALSLGCLLLAVPGWASAATGDLETLTGTAEKTGVVPPDDTVTKTVDSVLKPVRDAAKPVTDTVEEAARPVREAVDEATKPVTDTVDEATKPVTDTVDEITKPVTDTVDEITKPGTDVTDPEPGPGTGPPGRGSTPAEDSVGQAPAPLKRDAPPTRPRNRTVEGPQNDAGRKAAATRGAVAAPVPLRPRQFTAAAAAEPIPTAVSAPAAESAADRFARAAVDASRAFRFPLLLAAAVLLFLGIQARLDAKDPKLAAPLADEELTFA